jgi:DUF438 domain-containing protein
MSTPSVTDAASGSVEQMITDEHAEIRAHLAHLGELASALAALDEATAHERAAAILDFLSNGLLPHATLEEASLYPAIDTLIGAGATRTMCLDHQAIRDMIAELSTVVIGQLEPTVRARAQRLLLVLEGLVTIHLWKEDVAYVPLLAQLDSAAYTALHTAIAAHAGHHEHGH